MTKFSYPIEIRTNEPGSAPVAQTWGKVPTVYVNRVSVGMTGTAAGVTTIPLFVAPAGSRFYDIVMDFTTAFDNATALTLVNIDAGSQVVATSVTGTAIARKTMAYSNAQLSANSLALSADTTVVARVSINTSTITAGEFTIYTTLI